VAGTEREHAVALHEHGRRAVSWQCLDDPAAYLARWKEIYEHAQAAPEDDAAKKKYDEAKEKLQTQVDKIVESLLKQATAESDLKATVLRKALFDGKVQRFIDALAVLLDGGLRSLRATNGGELPVVSEVYRIGIVRAYVNAAGG